MQFIFRKRCNLLAEHNKLLIELENLKKELASLKADLLALCNKHIIRQ